jgi:hypothetical protein
MKKILCIILLMIINISYMLAIRIDSIPKSFNYKSDLKPLTSEQELDSKLMPYVNSDSLMKFEKVKEFIESYLSLPGIPKQDEIISKGINIGQMNAILLQKIEELTLYIIKIDKQNKEQKKDLEILKTQIYKLEELK